jgi:polyphosphate kinase
VRREAGGVRRYAHVGTGNYNPVTARLYEDMGLLTADAEIGADLTDLFNLLTGYSRQRQYRRLLVAPDYLRPEMVDLIRGQAREGGRIVLKMNALVDPDMVDALYEASQAGAEIDLIVRGICCLRPGIPGLSERITVRSLVGRYLEHSRIFRFGERREASHYIGSADLMQRNLDRRIEVLLPVEGARQRQELMAVLDSAFADNVSCWQLEADGSWRRRKTGKGERVHNHQVNLQRRAKLRLRRAIRSAGR